MDFLDRTNKYQYNKDTGEFSKVMNTWELTHSFTSVVLFLYLFLDLASNSNGSDGIIGFIFLGGFCLLCTGVLSYIFAPIVLITIVLPFKLIRFVIRQIKSK